MQRNSNDLARKMDTWFSSKFSKVLS